MNGIWLGLGMGIISGALGLMGIAGLGLALAWRGFAKAVRETEAEDAARWRVLCTVFPGVETVEDCREKRRIYPETCDACMLHTCRPRTACTCDARADGNLPAPLFRKEGCGTQTKGGVE